MKIEQIKTSELVPYANNAKLHSDEQVKKIAASIKEFKFNNPVLIDKDNGIIAGHGRVLAAELLKLKEVPCIRLGHLTEAQKKAYILADNRLGDIGGGWNEELLKIELEGLKELDFNIDLTGFDDSFLSFVEEPTEGLIEDDEIPEVAEPKVKLGDVWQLGDHRLLCGDCTDRHNVERLMAGEKADFVLTDPPYNQETDGGFESEIGASLKKQSGDIAHLCDFEPETVLPILPIAHKKGIMNATIFCNKDLVPRYLNWAVDNKYSFNILVWKKPSAIPLGGSYQPDVEYCLVFRRAAKFNTKQPGVSYSKVLEHKRETGLYPTMKPVDMLENQIKIVSDSGDLCLDLFGGSGSTLIACEKTGRNCYMMELDPKYCDVIINRWEKFTGETAIKC